MSTSQGTYGRIEQTLYVIRDAYETCGGLGGGLELGTAALTLPLNLPLTQNFLHF